jgi:hypothetical protein
MIRKLLTLAGLLSFAASNVFAATPAQPEIAFIGDAVTYQWGQQPQFLKHPNWVSYGANIEGMPGSTYVANGAALLVLQGIIRSGKKPVIHLLVGEADSESESPGNQHSSVFAFWAEGFEELIKTAQEAKLEVIVGTIPYSYFGDVSDMNQWILTYCAAHNIPVINYAFALNSGTGFAASGHDGSLSPGQPLPPQVPSYYLGPPVYGAVNLSSQGFDLLTDMAEVAIGTATGAIKLKGGYLNTVVYADNEDDGPSFLNSNGVIDGGVVQFTAYGEYTDGSVHPFRNADINGHIGTWTNSNPLALSLDQNGVGTGLAKGSTNVHFTTPSGATLAEWVMYTSVTVYGCPDCNINY